jgi:hypothetical protein
MASRRPRLRKLLEKMRLAKRVPINTVRVATTIARVNVLRMISIVFGRNRIASNSSPEMLRTRRVR